jgi:hypothetical protein
MLASQIIRVSCIHEQQRFNQDTYPPIPLLLVFKVLSHSPAIPQEKLDDLVSDLNSSRALFTFIKRMRVAFKEEIERQRLAQKAARKGE